MIDPLIAVTSIKALPGFKLRLRFSDGAEGLFDCSAELWGEAFAPLKDPKFFAKVSLDHGAPTWPNGADLDPSVLRKDIVPIRTQLKKTAAKISRRPKNAVAVAEAQASYAAKPARKTRG